jgi:hypothetical protein
MAPNETLKQWLEANDLAAAEFARRVQYDRSNFHRILKGDLRPSLNLALSIERETGGHVPMSAWAQAA